MGNRKQLTSAAVGGKTVSFEYNASGIRTEKHLANTHDVYYRLIGDKVVEMVIDSTRGIERLVFIYDDSGALYGIRYYEGYNDTVPAVYTFMLNLQGDVVRILDVENGIVANYVYDAWGNILAITDANGNAITMATHVANMNPIRYRGYFYDTEIGFYYCNSRYYDPGMRRFLNADGYVSTGQGFVGFNMYAYCGNNPTNRIDVSGLFWVEIKDWIKDKYTKAKTWVGNTFGTATYVTYTMNESSTDYLIAGAKSGAYTTELVSGNDDKPIVFYAEFSPDDGIIPDLEFGFAVNFENSSVNVGIGSSSSISYTKDNTSYNFSSNLFEPSLGTSHSTYISDTITKNEYIEVYVNPVVAEAVVVLALGAASIIQPIGAAGGLGALVYSLA